MDWLEELDVKEEDHDEGQHLGVGGGVGEGEMELILLDGEEDELPEENETGDKEQNEIGEEKEDGRGDAPNFRLKLKRSFQKQNLYNLGFCPNETRGGLTQSQLFKTTTIRKGDFVTI